jgi:hypothetical protein
MEKTIYILQNIENVEEWAVFKTLQEAETSKHIAVNFYLSPDKRAEEGKKWVIITKQI